MGGINDRSRSSTGVGGQSPGPRGQRGGSNTSSPGGNNNGGGEGEMLVATIEIEAVQLTCMTLEI